MPTITWDKEVSRVCLPAEILRLPGSTLEQYFFVLVFPSLFVIGLLGNMLNLLVLLSPESRSRKSTNRKANDLLVALAFVDIFFFLFMLPHSLANFDRFGSEHKFRLLYFPMKMHLLALANWCSAVAMWLVIVICAERLIGVRSMGAPSTRNCFSCLGVRNTILVIITGTGLLTFYHHVSHTCVMRELCHGTQVVAKCFDVLQESWSAHPNNITAANAIVGKHSASILLKTYVSWSQVANATLVILLPILIMAIMNGMLLVVVKKRRLAIFISIDFSFLVYSRLNPSSGVEHARSRSGDAESEKSRCSNRRFSLGTIARPSSLDSKLPATRPVDYPSFSTSKSHLWPSAHSAMTGRSSGEMLPAQQVSQQTRRTIEHAMQNHAQHRCTVTVCAIVTCFSLTQGPSAIMLSISFWSGHKPPFVASTPWWYNANAITSFLVIFGKTLNFVLFCLSSATFRKRLVSILKRRFSSCHKHEAGWLPTEKNFHTSSLRNR